MASKDHSQEELSRKALAEKEKSPPETTKPDDRTANEGMNPTPRDVAPSGALDHAGQPIVRQRSKFARQ